MLRDLQLEQDGLHNRLTSHTAIPVSQEFHTYALDAVDV